MDQNSLPPAKPPLAAWKPERCDRIALVLQGGGALGAYQAGVYQALHEAGLEPDWVNGVSIGAINAAIIAGNRPERRVERLREFWETITARPGWMALPDGVPQPDGDWARQFGNTISAFGAMALGQPGFFQPHRINPWLSPRGATTAASFYDTAPLRETLLKLVDFDLLNSGTVRYAAGAVNVASGNFAYFDNNTIAIVPEHIMASGALPPALPMTQIGTDWFWDGGLVSNTPLQHLLEQIGGANALVFQVDLFSSRGIVPRDMYEVLSREKDIRFSSRTRLITDYFRHHYRLKVQLRDALAKVPEDLLTEVERRLKEILSDLPEITILQMVYQQRAYEGQAKDYEFSARSMREHWDSGYRDTERTLRHKDWLAMCPVEQGIVVHDIHRAED